MTKTNPPVAEGLRLALRATWTDFLDANPDDLTSPEDLPDHALMTGEQFEHWGMEALAACDEATAARIEALEAHLAEATEAIGVCIDGFEKSNPTLGGMAVIHMLTEARSRYRSLLSQGEEG